MVCSIVYNTNNEVFKYPMLTIPEGMTVRLRRIKITAVGTSTATATVGVYFDDPSSSSTYPQFYAVSSTSTGTTVTGFWDQNDGASTNSALGPGGGGVIPPFSGNFLNDLIPGTNIGFYWSGALSGSLIEFYYDIIALDGEDE